MTHVFDQDQYRENLAIQRLLTRGGVPLTPLWLRHLGWDPANCWFALNIPTGAPRARSNWVTRSSMPIPPTASARASAASERHRHGCPRIEEVTPRTWLIAPGGRGERDRGAVEAASPQQ